MIDTDLEAPPKELPATEQEPPTAHMAKLASVASKLGPPPALQVQQTGDNMGELQVIPRPQSDLPDGGLLGDVPLSGMIELISDGSVAGTQVLVNGGRISMLQHIEFSVDAAQNMAVLKLQGLTKNLRILGAIVEVKMFERRPETDDDIEIPHSQGVVDER
jgi:hypothetical protein